MDAATWGAIGTAAGVVVALGAVAIAIWQARIAKASADAALAQVALVRQQMEVESSERDSRDAPTFALSPKEAELGEYTARSGGSATFVPLAKNMDLPPGRWTKRTPVEVRMLDGPGRVSIEVELIHSYGDDVKLGQSGPYEIVPGGTRAFAVMSAYHLNNSSLEVVIRSTESQGAKRSWTCVQEIGL